MPKFDVTIQVPFNLAWKLSRKDLNFEFQLKLKLYFMNIVETW
jgi:hypothetical protein